MKKLLTLLLFTTSIFAQQPVDSLFVAKDSVNVVVSDSINPTQNQELFSTEDLKMIDSLLIEEKFNSSLFDSIQYVINDKDILGNTTTILTTDLLKKRLQDLNVKTPFHLEYNPALEKVINSYLKYRKKYYPALMARAQYYFPMFEQ